ncbi:hypothetical protein SpCBS45565_g05266 [Spizellomyces sp. 'palustris']|nr:hypothetical protein SpCBS45565_g05266 [Spizellomyces sp. 'palustris']
MPRSNLGERVYIPLEDLEASVAEADEAEDDVGDITELSREHRKTPAPSQFGSSASVSSSTAQGGLGGLRRRLSKSFSTRPSASNLLEQVLMKSVSRSASFNTSAGYFPHPVSAPSFSRLPIPWSSTGAPRDSREADMLCGLAMGLSSYGAPLYRVEHRIAHAADELNIPISLFCLPSTLMVAIGDGSARHPCRVQYLSYCYAVHIGKLHDVDQLARRASKLRVSNNGGSSSSRRVSSASEKGKVSVSSMTIQHSNRVADAVELGRASVSDRPSTPEKPSDVDMDSCLAELETIMTSPGDYHRFLRIMAGAVQSGVVVVLLFKGSWADGLAALLLGAFTSFCLYLSDLFGLEGAVELLAAMAVAALARFIEPFGFWSAISGTGMGLCHEVVSLGGVCQLLPGTAITLGMLEVGSSNPVAGSVRMFQAFIRALKLGYGLSTGSRIAVHLFELFDAWEDSGIDACPVPGRTAIDFWRLPLWIPMNISIMINLRAYPWQWPHMSLTSLIGYCVSLLASQWFNSDITAGMAAFSIAIAANLYARRKNEIAVGATLAGIVWLVPGGIGVRGVMAALAKDAASSGTAFGIDMMTRAMSIAVGLYMANVVAFPIITDRAARDALRDKMMTV